MSSFITQTFSFDVNFGLCVNFEFFYKNFFFPLASLGLDFFFITRFCLRNIKKEHQNFDKNHDLRFPLIRENKIVITKRIT